MATIKIYKVDDEKYGTLSNNFKSYTNIDGETWMSVSNYIYTKALPSIMYTDIMKKASPINIHNVFENCKRKAEEDILSVALLEALRVKFQNPLIMDILLKTGNSPIIYKSNNSLLGDGKDGNGKNMLGNYMVQIRDEVLNAQKRRKQYEEREGEMYKAYLARYVLNEAYEKNDDDLSEYFNLSFDEIIDKYGREKLSKVAFSKSNFLEFYNESPYKNILIMSMTYPNVLIFDIRKNLQNLANRKEKKLKNKVFDMFMTNVIKKKFPTLDSTLYDEYKNKMYLNLTFEQLEIEKNKVYNTLLQNENPLQEAVRDLTIEAKIPTKEEIKEAISFDITNIDFLEKDKSKSKTRFIEEIIDIRSETPPINVESTTISIEDKDEPSVEDDYNPFDSGEFIRNKKPKIFNKFMQELQDNSSDSGESDDEIFAVKDEYDYETKYKPESDEAKNLEKVDEQHKEMLKKIKEMDKEKITVSKIDNPYFGDLSKDEYEKVKGFAIKKEGTFRDWYTKTLAESKNEFEKFKKNYPKEYGKYKMERDQEKKLAELKKKLDEDIKKKLEEKFLQERELYNKAVEEFTKKITEAKKITGEGPEVRLIENPDKPGEFIKRKIVDKTKIGKYYTESDEPQYDLSLYDPKTGRMSMKSKTIPGERFTITETDPKTKVERKRMFAKEKSIAGSFLVPSVVDENAFTLSKALEEIYKSREKEKEIMTKRPVFELPSGLINIGEPFIVMAGDPPENYVIKDRDFQLLSPIYYTGMLKIKGLEYPTVTHYLYATLFTLEYEVNDIKNAYEYILNYPLEQYNNLFGGEENPPSKFVYYKYLGEYLNYVSFEKNTKKFEALATKALDMKFVDMKYQDVLIETGNKAIIWNDKRDSYLGTKEITTYNNITREKYASTEEFVIALRRNAKTDKSGLNFVGKYLMTLRNKILDDRLDETIIGENNFNKLYNNLAIKEWANLKVDDMCKTILKFNQYYIKEYDSTINFDNDRAVKLIIKNIYGRSAKILSLVEDINTENIDLSFREYLKKYKNRLYVYDGVFWSNIFSSILYIIRNIEKPTIFNIEKTIYNSKLLLSENNPCTKILPTADNKLNCIVGAIIKILQNIENIYNEGIDVKLEKNILSRMENIVDFKIDKLSIELAVSIILNTKNLIKLEFELTEKMIFEYLEETEIDNENDVVEQDKYIVEAVEKEKIDEDDINAETAGEYTYDDKEEVDDEDAYVEEDNEDEIIFGEGEGEGEFKEEYLSEDNPEENQEEYVEHYDPEENELRYDDWDKNDDGSGKALKVKKRIKKEINFDLHIDELYKYLEENKLFSVQVSRLMCKFIITGALFVSKYKNMPLNLKRIRYNNFNR